MSAPSIPYIEQSAGKGAARAMRRRNRKVGLSGGSDRKPRWLTYVSLTVVLLISFYPLYFAFLLSSMTTAEIAVNQIPSLIPSDEFLTNLRRVWDFEIDLPRAVLNSTIVGVAVTSSVVFFSTLAGFAFSKLRFRGRGPLLVFVIATMAVPAQLGVVPLYIIMANLGLINTLWAVIIPALVSAFGVFWMTQYLDGALPYELIEAARVDGASMFRTFRSIAVPSARPAMAMLGLFTFIGSWTAFFWPNIALDNKSATLPVALQLLQSGFFKDTSLIMTGVIVSVIPLFILFLLAGRQLVAGVMQGAVKG